MGVEHKSNGGARYEIKDHGGHKHQIADKAINYAMAMTPNDAKNLKHIFDTFQAAFEQPDTSLQKDLDISPELLEMAWEEALEEETHELTPNSLIELIHSHVASKIEAYKAWRLMRSDIAHVFFKEIKDHGRVLSFKAKPRRQLRRQRKTSVVVLNRLRTNFAGFKRIILYFGESVSISAYCLFILNAFKVSQLD